MLSMQPEPLDTEPTCPEEDRQTAFLTLLTTP